MNLPFAIFLLLLACRCTAQTNAIYVPDQDTEPDEPVVVQPATTTVTLAWDAATDSPDGYLAQYDGEAQDLPANAAGLEAIVSTNASTRFYLMEYVNVVRVIHLPIQGQVVNITNGYTPSAAVSVVYCPPGTLELQVSNNISLLSFATVPGQTYRVLSSASPAGPFLDANWLVIGDTNTTVTLPIPQSNPQQQFYRLGYQ